MIHFLRIVVRGAGDLASGVAVRLWRAGFRQLVLLERESPLAVRRLVCFSEAVREGLWTVEGITAKLAANRCEAEATLQLGCIPVLVDPAAEFLRVARPDVLIDAVMAKRNLGTRQEQAELVIAIGPGFTAGLDCHRVVETQRGHGLGRVIASGSALPNTGVPGAVMGHTIERVLRSPAQGIFKTAQYIGREISVGDIVGTVAGLPVVAGISGVLRGLLPDNIPVSAGLKLGDIDPRGGAWRCGLVSDKALAVAGGVLEAILQRFNLGQSSLDATKNEPWP